MSQIRLNHANAQPTILNLILLGTGYHRLQKKGRSLLTELASHIETGPNQSVHLIDGLGGEPDKDSPQAKNHPLLGTYDFQCDYDASTGVITTQKTDISSIFGTSALSGKLKGSGYREAMAEAILVIETMIAAEKKPLIINMYGFSRGGDTALRICNVLHSMHKPEDVKVNIFAIDPVAGTGRRKAKKAQLIPNNVEEFYAILMQDENSLGFGPQDKRHLKVQDPHHTIVKYQIYGGNHNTGMRIHTALTGDAEVNNYNTATTDTARLVWDDLHKFAWRHATLVKAIPYLKRTITDNQVAWTQYEYKPFTERERLAIYTRMSLNRELYARHKPTMASINIRDIAQTKYDYFLQGAKYFQDKEHQELFYMSYPHFFDYYFQKNMGGAVAGKVFADILKLQENPEMIASLKVHKNLDIALIQQVSDLGPPRGIYLTINDLKDGIAQLWEKVLMIVNPVLIGQDESIKIGVALQLIDTILQIIVSKNTAAEKVELTHHQIAETLKAHQKSDGIFLHKLSNLLVSSSSSLAPSESKERYSRNIKDSLRKHTQPYRLFDKKPVTKAQDRIAGRLAEMLDYIEILQMGNDKKTLSQLLNLALMQSRKILNEYQIKGETALDKILRQCLLEITGYTDTPKSDLVKEELRRLMVKFENDLNEISTPTLASPVSKAASSTASNSPASASSSLKLYSPASPNTSPSSAASAAISPESPKPPDSPVSPNIKKSG
jgi:hypothetical protein